MASVAKLSRVAINRILLATDFSSESQKALQCAISLAKRYNSKLFITHAVQPDAAMRGMDMQVALPDLMHSNADQNIARIEQKGDLKSLPHAVILRSGEPWQIVSEVMSEENIELIVMGTHGRGGISKLFLGSTAEKAMRHASCPVLTVGSGSQSSLDRIGHILYATDFSDGSMCALPYALAFAEEDGAELIMLHVIETKPSHEGELVRWKSEDLQKMHEMVPTDVDLACRPEIEVEAGSPAEEILRLATTRNVELIVMGAHPDGPVTTHLPWTTLHHVLQHAQCPVLTVRARTSGFVN